MNDNMVLVTLGYRTKLKAIGKVYNAQVTNSWMLHEEIKIIAFQQYAAAKNLVDLKMLY
jgi:hypothetical protein